MLENSKHINYFTLTFALVLFTLSTNAQEVRVIDNKGTIQKINNNTVTTSDTQPTNPVENDIWFETKTTVPIDHTLIKVYDGASWIELVPKAARIFYPPSIAIDASTVSANLAAPGDETKNLYLEYSNQFTLADATTSTSSSGAPSTIPIYAPNELYYYVTYYDKDIFDNVSIDANGVMTYDIKNTPTDDNTIINVVFVVK